MYFYQVQKQQQRIVVNGYINDENYICSLTMKASIVLAIIQSMVDSNKRAIIDVTKSEIVQLVSHLEKFIKPSNVTLNNWKKSCGQIADKS